MKLSELAIGKSAIIKTVNGDRMLRGHLLDMGLTPKCCVTVRSLAPLGDPMELLLRGYRLTIRKDEAKNIEVDEIGFSCTGNCSKCKVKEAQK